MEAAAYHHAASFTLITDRWVHVLPGSLLTDRWNVPLTLVPAGLSCGDVKSSCGLMDSLRSISMSSATTSCVKDWVDNDGGKTKERVCVCVVCLKCV